MCLTSGVDSLITTDLFAMCVSCHWQAAIWHCLNHYAYSDAIFLAERLYAESKYLHNTQTCLVLISNCCTL